MHDADLLRDLAGRARRQPRRMLLALIADGLENWQVQFWLYRAYGHYRLLFYAGKPLVDALMAIADRVDGDPMGDDHGVFHVKPTRKRK